MPEAPVAHNPPDLSIRSQQDGWSVFLDRRPVRRDEAFRSEMASGLWLGAVISADLETEEPLFGRRRWHGPSAMAFWAPQAMSSDLLVLADSEMASLFVHLDDTAVRHLGLDARGLNAWGGHSLAPDGALLRQVIRDVQ